MSTNAVRGIDTSVAPVDMKFEIVVIPVSDVDRAKEFYAKLGWRLDADFDNGKDFRIVQFTPHGSGCSIIFGKNVTAAAPGSAQGLYLIVSDLQAARQALLDRGIAVSEVFHGAADAYSGPAGGFRYGRRLHRGNAAGDRGRDLEDSGQTGRSDQGARGADGQEPARAGQAGRSSHAVIAADPRWRALADTTPDYNDPEVLAESEAAARLPEPDSVQPAKSLTALERAAADAEEVWRQLEPTLTEDERALVNNMMDQLKLDTEARSRIITDGVACLAVAIG